MFDPNIKASLVYDGRDLFLPKEMGQPSHTQMMGTIHERLSELCCRVCYDSLGRGRTSEEMHNHLLDVGHWSVYEHAHTTLVLDLNGVVADYDKIPWYCLGRPGLAVRQLDGPSLALTYNYRHLLDWDRWSNRLGHCGGDLNRLFNTMLLGSKAPLIVNRLKPKPVPVLPNYRIIGSSVDFEDHKWVSIFLSGSRGMSHEQVRHRFCMSQRSTRYCNETESPWVMHPLLQQYLDDATVDAQAREEVNMALTIAINRGRDAYDQIVQSLQPYLIKRGADKQTSLKQARGAGRGYLGNALMTELIYSASVADWKDMFRLRYSAPADAEIRLMYGPVLEALKSSQYGECFADFDSMPAPDGIGTILKENK